MNPVHAMSYAAIVRLDVRLRVVRQVLVRVERDQNRSNVRLCVVRTNEAGEVSSGDDADPE